MKSIKTNFIYNIIYQVLVIILPFITSPYISRVLGAKGLGVFSYYNSIVNYFLLFAMLGISNYGNRGVAACKDNKDKLNAFFSEVFTFQVVLNLIIGVLYLLYIIFICKSDSRLIAAVMYLFLFSGFFDISWLFFGLEEFKITVTRNIIIKLCTVISIFIFVKNTDDVLMYSIIISGGTFISQAYLWKYVKKYVSYHIPCVSDMIKHSKDIFILFIPVLSYSVYKIMDKIMLGYMTSYEQVGYYANAEKATNIPIGVITAFGTVMLPRMSNLIANNSENKINYYINISVKFITIIACAISFGLFGISEVFTTVFFGKGYESCVVLIRLLSISVLFTSWTTVVRTQYLIPKKKDSVYVSSTVVGAVFNLIINAICIPLYGAVGAAMGTVVAEISMLIIQVFCVRKEINFIKKIISEIYYIIGGIFMACCVFGIGVYYGTSLKTLIFQIVFGSLIYVLFAIIVIIVRKDLVYQSLYSTIKNKRKKRRE